jgi:ATP-dependent DNA helicase DinG
VRAPSINAAVGALETLLEELRATLQRGPGATNGRNLPDAFLDVLPELETAISDIATQLEGLGAGAGVSNCARRAAALANSLASLRELSDDTGLRWVDANPNGLLLQYTPFEVAERLREYVESRPCAWVFTSATLAIGEDFSHFAARVGLPEARTLRIDSPFDYRDQARIFLPPHMPEPQSPAFAASFIEACAPLLEASGGRAFLLYTSYRALAEGVRALQVRFPNPAVSSAGAG